MKNKEFVGFDRLKQTVSIGQILERYGLLAGLRRSGDSLSGACPLHRGHNKSQFRVSISKNCWICFGDCHIGGSIVDFVSRKEGVGIRDAARLIQEWFGVQVDKPDLRVNGKAHLPSKAKTATSDQNGDIPITFNPPLRFTLPLNHGHSYLIARGLSQRTIETFGIGYCAQGTLAGWIAIPIHNAAGQIVAYAGRWPGKPTDGQPKYKLPKGFRKSLELFNLHRACSADARLPLVVVEGFFGCMHIWQAGHSRVVSLMGSMLSPAQEELILKIAGAGGRIMLMFDEDEAGRKGRSEAQSRLCRYLTISTVKFHTTGMQPDQLSSEHLQELLSQARRGERGAV